MSSTHLFGRCSRNSMQKPAVSSAKAMKNVAGSTEINPMSDMVLGVMGRSELSHRPVAANRQASGAASLVCVNRRGCLRRNCHTTLARQASSVGKVITGGCTTAKASGNESRRFTFARGLPGLERFDFAFGRCHGRFTFDGARLALLMGQSAAPQFQPGIVQRVARTGHESMRRRN